MTGYEYPPRGGYSFGLECVYGYNMPHMLDYIQALVLGAMQGLTELFPVSSLGHSVVLPALLNWSVDEGNPLFLPFLVATHMATALVLLGFFWRDWLDIVKGFFRSIAGRSHPGDIYAKLSWLIIIGTIPAGLIGLIFQKKLQAIFAVPLFVAVVLVFNGLALLAVEAYKKRHARKVFDASNAKPGPGHSKGGFMAESDRRISGLRVKNALYVGLCQCLALIPGFSRTGMTLGGGLMNGLNHEDAARYSFLLATPIIFAAAALKLPALAHVASGGLGPTILGALAAAGTAYFSVTFLVRYFQTRNLNIFGIYCILAGIVSVVLIH